MTQKTEVWADTGETVERELTEAEAEQLAIDQAKAQAEDAAKKQADKVKEQAKKAAIEHAKSLGFTDEMIAVLYPTLEEE